ncbi:hypothetical protein EGT07_03215 [Herbaspirillum sp. HC18]|nr:hypothetical protein EGT07_03215 [Herbaspirillum sp. HC18]
MSTPPYTLTTDNLIASMACARGAREKWNERDRHVYGEMLRGLVRVAKKEAMWPHLSVSEGVIDVILQSRLGTMDKHELADYLDDLRKLVTLAKSEKKLEIKCDLARALGLTSRLGQHSK